MIDLKKFKKVASDKHTTTMRHEDGHELKVVHSVLSPKLRKGIERLPMADGGQVEEPKSTDTSTSSSTSTSTSIPSDEALKVLQGYTQQTTAPWHKAHGGKIPHYADGGEPRRPTEEEYYDTPEKSDEDLPPPIKPQEAEIFTPGNVGATIDEATKGATPEPSSLQDSSVFPVGHVGEAVKSASEYEQPHEGLSVLSGANAPQENPLVSRLNQINQQAQSPVLGQQAQRAYRQNIDQNALIAQNFAANKAKIDAEHQALVHDIMNNHINMSDYWKQNDKGAAALGALLGGMGSGLTGLSNPVPGMIANSQDNFLKAELANMDNPKSLLSAVQSQYGNNQNAADVMRIISNEALNSHLQKVMAPLNSQTAQANAAQVQMQLMQNTESLKQQIAMRQAVMGGGPGMDPAMAVRFLVPEPRQKEVFDEIGKAQLVKSSEGNLLGMFDAMDKENTVLGRAGRLGFQPPSVSSYEANILPLIRDKEGRVNEFELNTVRALEPKPGDRPSTVKEKRIGLQKFLEDKKAAPTAKGFGIDLDKFESTSPTPSVETATMNGKLYRKVPGGWAPVQ